VVLFLELGSFDALAMATASSPPQLRVSVDNKGVLTTYSSEALFAKELI
jgi:hypothetical protein